MRLDPAALGDRRVALFFRNRFQRSDFGAISIRPEFSLLELPADLPQATLDALASTRISGKLIELQRDKGPAMNRGGGAPARGGKPYRGNRD